MLEYHDKEWGRPCHDDKLHFEYIILDTFQAGLSWQIILHKRKNFRRAFSNFNLRAVAKYDKRKLKSLMKDKSIVRNRLKIEAAVKNAKAFLKVQKEFGSFDKYIWQFTGLKTIDNKAKKISNIRSKSPESDAMSKDLKKRDFAFVGSTVCYAYMQGAGMVNDHLSSCFVYPQLKLQNKK